MPPASLEVVQARSRLVLLLLPLAATSAACVAEVPDRMPAEVIDDSGDKSLGGLVIDDSCASLGEGFPDYRPIIRAAYERGAAVVRSEAFAEAVRGADYRGCAVDPGDPSRPDEVLEWAIHHSRTDSVLHVACSHHTDRWGHAYGGDPSMREERIWLARPFLNESGSASGICTTSRAPCGTR